MEITKPSNHPNITNLQDGINSGSTWIYSPTHWTLTQSFTHLRHLYLILETLYFVTDESLKLKMKERFSRYHSEFLPLSEPEWNLVFSALRDPSLLPTLFDTLVEESTFRKLEKTIKALIWDVLRPLSLRSENDWQSVADEIRRLANQFSIAPIHSLTAPAIYSHRILEDSGLASKGPSLHTMKVLSQSIDLPLTISRAWYPDERSERIGPYPIKKASTQSIEILLPHCPHQLSEPSEALKSLACILQIHWAWGRIQNFTKGLCIEHRIPEHPSPITPCEIKLFVPNF